MSEDNTITAGSANIIHGNSSLCNIIQGSSNEILNLTNVNIIGDNIIAENDNTFYVGCSKGLLCSGDIVAFSTSDKRLKENIVRLTNCLEKILKIDGVGFEWNENQDVYKGKDIGLIAQQIQKILPSAVKRGVGGYLTVDYKKIIPLLIGAIQQQGEMIDQLSEDVLK